MRILSINNLYKNSSIIFVEFTILFYISVRIGNSTKGLLVNFLRKSLKKAIYDRIKIFSFISSHQIDVQIDEWNNLSEEIISYRSPISIVRHRTRITPILRYCLLSRIYLCAMERMQFLFFFFFFQGWIGSRLSIGRNEKRFCSRWLLNSCSVKMNNKQHRQTLHATFF